MANFVISTGRCGSTLLSTLLRSHPEVLSISEFFSSVGSPALLTRCELTGGELFERLSSGNVDLRAAAALENIPELLRPIGPSGADTNALMWVMLPHLTPEPEALLVGLRSELMSYTFAAADTHLRRLFDWLSRQCGRRVWVERSGGSIEYVDEIQRIWPAARLVYLVRDGRDCAYSMSQHPMFRIRLARILSRNPSLDPRTALNSHIPLDRFGAYWSALMQRVERSLASTTPRNRLVLSYEDLITDVATQLRRLSTFLELDESAVRRWTQLARDVVRPSTSRWQGLTAPERSTLERACRPGLRALERVLSRYGV